jgi:nucleoid-associated protein YgaU
VPQLLRAATGGVLLVVALVVIPVGLWFAGQQFVPSLARNPSDALHDLLSRDSGSLLLAVITLAGLLAAAYAWLAFTVALLVEVAARVGGYDPAGLPTLGWAQGAAALLLGLIVVALPATSGAATAVAGPVPAHMVTGAQPVVVATTAAVPAPAQPAAAPSITTVRGDSLWHLAELHLSTGMRWHEIVALNVDRPQADGTSLSEDDTTLAVGWALELPPDATGVTAPDAGPPDLVVVQAGDTLSALAQSHLGDGDRWPELATSSAGLVQPGGVHLTDPDLIDVGWTVAIPRDAPQVSPPIAVPAPAVPTAPPAPTLPPPPPRVTAPSATPTPTTASPAPSTAIAPERVGDTLVSTGWSTLEGASAVGGMLATGLVGVLGLNRVRRTRRRQPGQRLTASPELSHVEQDLRSVQTPASVHLLNAALRTWAERSPGAELPDVTGAVIGGGTIVLVLDAPAAATSPFVPGPQPTIWLLDRTDTIEPHTTGPAPFPTLVTLGHTAADEVVLLDLERAGMLTLIGATDDVTDVLCAMAVELALSEWADHLDVTVVGIPSDLVDALGRGRLHTAATVDEVLDRLERHKAESADALAEDGAISTVEARVHRTADQTWTPELLLTAVPLDAGQSARLEALLVSEPTNNIAAVVAAATEDAPDHGWVVRVPGSGRTELPMFDTSVELQRLTGTDRNALVIAIRVTTDDGQEDGPNSTDVPTEPRHVVPTGEPGDPKDVTSEADQAELAVLLHIDPGAPEIQVLGPVCIAGAPPYDGDSGAASKVLELAVYLALNPGRSGADVSAALGDEGSPWADATRRSRLSMLRTWLGADAAGVDYVQRSSLSAGLRMLPTVRTDWARFQALANRGLTRGPDGVHLLDAALQLVRAIPFSGSPYRRYLWADVERQEMINRIADVAHAAAVGHLHTRPRDSRDASLRGLRCDPTNETLFRDLMRAEYCAGNLDGVRLAAERLRRITEELGVDMDLATTVLLEELLDYRTRAAREADR